MTVPSAHELIPSARRLITSLRDMGYDFPQAVADIVDNSVEAKSSLVAIDIEFEGNDSWVRIADNGTGMKPHELREALRFGADRDYEEDDLGKFGLGLKTASMSQCQRLSVASRSSKARTDITAYSWDLEHIQKTDRWEILPLTGAALTPSLKGPLEERTGTVVLWERLDRILGYKLPYGEFARKRILQMCRELEQHLGMVFERFLSKRVRRKHLRLIVNGNPVTPWDPFCRTEKKTIELEPMVFHLEHEGASGEVLLQPYILPHQDDFSTLDAFRAASGPRGWNQQQGFYIHRANRLIQSGGWSNLRAPDEHTKLARIAVSFPPALDEAFKINVAKMRVQMPSQIRDEAREACTAIAKQARTVYDRRDRKAGGSKGTLLAGTPTPASSQTPSEGGKPGQAPSAPEEPRLTFREWMKHTLAVSKPSERRVLTTVFSRLSAKQDLGTRADN